MGSFGILVTRSNARKSQAAQKAVLLQRIEHLRG